jgi:putative CocE/NonD family hydrolase
VDERGGGEGGCGADGDVQLRAEAWSLKMALVDCGNGVRLERGVKFRLSDGTTLVSDHYYPVGEGPWPTLLMRQPYGRDIASTVVYAHPVWFARHGYHVAIQDVRGRGGSEGTFYPFRNEGADGVETIAWLRGHASSNGRIGMYGFSYQGAAQLLAAAEQPEGLECIAPHMTATDLYHGWFYHQGALRLSSSLGWGVQMLREDARRLGLREASDRLETAWANVRTEAGHVPYGSHPAIADPKLPSYVRDWFAHREPGEYWTRQDVSTRVDRIQVPALHIAGWFDTYLEGSIAGYLALRERAGSEFARENQFLIAGPWVHIPWGDRVGDANLGGAANLDTDTLLLRWFDHWLKDSGDFGSESRVRYFALGKNEWRSAEEWPNATGLALYLHSGGEANSRKGDGDLSLIGPQGEEPRDVFVYDPEVPVFAPGGLQALSGPFDQSGLEMGNNLLVYTSGPTVREAEIFGQIRVVLHAVTSAPHADFTAKIIRVTANGRAEFVSIGIARSSWLFREKEYAADAIHAWEFNLEPTAFALAVGERVRLEIASSAFPLYDRNPSTDVPPQDADNWNWGRSTQQVLHTATHPSVLYLPLTGDSPW